MNTNALANDPKTLQPEVVQMVATAPAPAMPVPEEARPAPVRAPARKRAGAPVTPVKAAVASEVVCTKTATLPEGASVATKKAAVKKTTAKKASVPVKKVAVKKTAMTRKTPSRAAAPATTPSEDFAPIAALHALQALSAPALRASLDALTPLKAGRPKREAN